MGIFRLGVFLGVFRLLGVLRELGVVRERMVLRTDVFGINIGCCFYITNAYFIPKKNHDDYIICFVVRLLSRLRLRLHGRLRLVQASIVPSTPKPATPEIRHTRHKPTCLKHTIYI